MDDLGQENLRNDSCQLFEKTTLPKVSNALYLHETKEFNISHLLTRLHTVRMIMELVFGLLNFKRD